MTDTIQKCELTEREATCLTLLANGQRYSDIALSLGITISTVTMHIKNARVKLGAMTTEHAVAIAVQRKLISTSEWEQNDP